MASTTSRYNCKTQPTATSQLTLQRFRAMEIPENQGGKKAVYAQELIQQDS